MTHAGESAVGEFSLPLGVVLGCCALTMVIVVVAAWVPARRAVRLNLLEALKYE